MFIEYPKSLYVDGDQELDHVIVYDADQEKEKRKQGYSMMGEPKEKAKRTRKVKNDDSTANH